MWNFFELKNNKLFSQKILFFNISENNSYFSIKESVFRNNYTFVMYITINLLKNMKNAKKLVDSGLNLYEIPDKKC